MKYQHKITHIVVEAAKFQRDTQVELISENKLILTPIKEGQYLVSRFNDKDEIISQVILNEDAFNNTYEPLKQLLLD